VTRDAEERGFVCMDVATVPLRIGLRTHARTLPESPTSRSKPSIYPSLTDHQ